MVLSLDFFVDAPGGWLNSGMSMVSPYWPRSGSAVMGENAELAPGLILLLLTEVPGWVLGVAPLFFSDLLLTLVDLTRVWFFLSSSCLLRLDC